MRTKFNGILTLIFALTVQFVFAQKTVSGTVSDESGPLPGVNILVKGTKTGTETDFDGKYSLKAKEGDVLIFSYVGMGTVERTVGASNVINVKMEAAGNVIDEVVITAFGVQREKKSVAYQTEKVSEDMITQAQATKVSSGLVGKVAGLNIQIQDNGVNPNVEVNLRGSRSITQSNAALIVIDGLEASTGALADLNPNDVENVSVLKGANAAALYGAQAANGALIITTKKGKKASKFSISLNSTSEIESIAYMPKFQTEYGSGWQGVYDAIENTNWGPRFDGQMRPIGPVLADGSQQMTAYAPIQDNLKDFFTNGFTFQNSLNFSGGDESSSYFISLGNQKTTGIIQGDAYNKYSFRANATKELGKLKLGFTANYTIDDEDVAGNKAGEQERALYWYILNTPANIPLSSYSDYKNYVWAKPENYYNGYYENPYWLIDNHRDADKSNRLTASIQMDYNLFENVNLALKGGVNKRSSNGKLFHAASNFKDVTYTRPSAQASYVEDSDAVSTIYNANSVLSFDFKLSDHFKFKPLVGADIYAFDYRFSQIRANNLSIEGFYDISNGTGQLEGNVTEAQLRRWGVFGDFTFSYNDYLFLNLTGRNDKTSTLKKGHNSYFYPSVGLSFVLTDAVPSIKETTFINYAKLTASYAVVHNDVEQYRINERFFQATGFPYGSINGFELFTNTANADLKHEQITTNEFGLNMEFWKNRITFDAAYYFGNTTNLILPATTPPSSGSSSVLTNLGKLESKGIELSLGVKAIKNDKFLWDVNANFTNYETKVAELMDGLPEVAVNNPFGTYGIYGVVGESFPQIKAVSYVRDSQGRVIVDRTTGNPLVGSLQNMGSSVPNVVVGLTNTFGYKNFKLTATLDYKTGHVYYSQLGDTMEFTGRSMESVSANRQDFIFPNSVYESPAGSGQYVENTSIQVTDGKQSFWTDVYNDIKENYVVDGTALKIREVALTYEVPAKMLQNSKFEGISIGLVSKNLLTFLPAENKFSDPDFNGEFSSNLNTVTNSIGIGGYYQAPPTRTFGLNVNLKF